VPLPAALAVIAAQQGLRRVGWMRLGDAAAGMGRLIWSVLVVGWPLLVAIGIIVWQLRRRIRAARQLRRGDDQTAPHRRPEWRRRVPLGLTAAAAGLLVFVAVLVVLPVLLVPAGAIIHDKELYKARNDLRGTLVQVLAGGLVATGLVFTARTLDLNRSGQVTERFTRTVDQLGQRELRKLVVRLGGI
jgi:ABC-type Fe3+ transport system permease subunit